LSGGWEVWNQGAHIWGEGLLAASSYDRREGERERERERKKRSN
jgi:hypothetical protein